MKIIYIIQYQIVDKIEDIKNVESIQITCTPKYREERKKRKIIKKVSQLLNYPMCHRDINSFNSLYTYFSLPKYYYLLFLKYLKI
uniref:Putative ovule protein n=1 Tax=Solanum chacoense TaxID=4108 RepID=A0A0V0GNL7_SOLCH